MSVYLKGGRPWVAAALAGAAIGLSAAPREMPALAFFGPALLIFALSDEEGEAVGARLALARGLFAGFVVNAITLAWAVELLMTFAHFPLPLALLVSLLLWLAQSLPFALGGLLADLLRRRAGFGRAWAVALAFTLAGIAPQLFPWRPSISQMPSLAFVQAAELGGPPLLDLFFFLAGAALAEGLAATLRGARADAARSLSAGALALLLPIGYGLARLPEVRAEAGRAPILRVGLVQPNVGIFEKHDPRLRPAHTAQLHRLTRALEARGAELTLWPESSYPYWVRRGQAEDPGGRLDILGEGVRGPVLAGAISVGSQGEEVLRFNSAVGVERGGRITGIADKVELLAFGEYVPFWDLLPPLQRYFDRGLSPGAGPQIVRLAGARIGVLNCYEDLLAGHVREQAAADPSFFANLTNDAWFGHTDAPYLHEMLARLRAVETRREIVRAVNTGVSAHILSTGEPATRSPIFEERSLLVELRPLSGRTPWVICGDLLCPALLLLAFVRVSLRRSRPSGR